MSKMSIYKNYTHTGNLCRISYCLVVLLFCGVLMLAGCVSVDPRQQRLVSKPNMQFSGSVIFSYQDKLLTQIESGSVSSVGGQSSNCGSCSAGGGQ